MFVAVHREMAMAGQPVPKRKYEVKAVKSSKAPKSYGGSSTSAAAVNGTTGGMAASGGGHVIAPLVQCREPWIVLVM